MQRNAQLINNRGVVSLREGRTFEACEQFLIASNLIADEQGYENSSTSTSGKVTRKRSSQQQTKKRTSCFRYSWTSVEASSDSKNISGTDNIGFYTFCQAVLISKSDSCSNHVGADSKWAVLFNLALSLNLLGYELGENKAGQEYLRRAHEIYKVIRHKFVSKVPQEHLGKLKMAIFNNMGIIYNEFSMFDEARECLDHVRRYLERQTCHERHHILLAGVLLQPTNVAPSA